MNRALDCDLGQPSLLSVDEAMLRLLDSVIPVKQTETILLDDALNRVLAKPVISSLSVPPADNSAMDGYAVRTVDLNEGVSTLPISQRIPAGSVGAPLEPGTAARIFTGAPVPVNADAVVMQEQVTEADGQAIFNNTVAVGENIRRAGEDIQKGEIIIKAGKILRAQELGLIASIGIPQVSVYKRLKVAIFITGDELVRPGESLQPGQIYNSNLFTFTGLLQSLNCEVVTLPHVPDDIDATKKALSHAAKNADLILSSGGVSVGEEDYVRVALQELGELTMWRMAIKPGKPVAYGHVDGTPFIGLPGNPVSVFVTFCWLVAPYIKLMQGRDYVPPAPMQVKAGFEWLKSGKRREYVRAQLLQDNGNPVAKIYPHQGSGVLSSTSWADGLVEILEGQTVNEGDTVKYWCFESLL